MFDLLDVRFLVIMDLVLLCLVCCLSLSFGMGCVFVYVSLLLGLVLPWVLFCDSRSGFSLLTYVCVAL